MKYKISLLIIFCSTLLLTHASNTSPSNPLNKAWSNRTGGIGAASFHSRMGLGLKWKGKKYSWEELIQSGFFFNALYLRILLSEFYCARCAVGASPFTNSALAQQADPSSFPDLSSTDQPNSPGLLPGGFDTATINDFFNKGTGYVTSLQAVRKQLAPLNDYANNSKTGTNKPSGKTPAPNPLATFAGIIIVPTAKWKLGNININDGQFFYKPRFFPYKNPTGTPAVISPNPSLQSQPGSLSTVTTANAYTSTTSGADTDPTSLTMSLNAAIKGLPNVKFCALTMTAWDKTASLNNAPLKLRLQEISLSVAGSLINISFYEGYEKSLTPQQIEIAHFFKYAVNNPWAVVIELDGDYGKDGSPVVTPTLTALVQLNPLQFSSIKNLSDLLDMPKNLYYSIGNTYDGLTDSQISQRTPTARLLRGIANGYLTSWNYKPLPSGSKTSNLMAWTDTYYASTYPTPTREEFQKNNDNYMFYGLYGCRQALSLMYIKQEAIESIESIIKNPQKSIPGYVGVGTSPLYQPVTTIVQQMGGVPIPKLNPLALQQAFTEILAVKNVSAGQYKKLIAAQKALNNFIIAANTTDSTTDSTTVKTSLKKLMSKLRGAGGGVAWPYRSNKVLKLPASKNFITAEESFRKIGKRLLKQNNRYLKAYTKELTLPPVQTIKYRPTPPVIVQHKATPPVIVHHKPTPPVQHKANPVAHSSTKSPTSLTSSASIKAYKAGYKDGLTAAQY